ALALAIYENDAIPEDIRSFVVMMVTGFVLFTLFVNAPTMGPLMAWLGLDKLSAADLDVRNRVLAKALSEVRDEIQDVARDYRIEPDIAQSIAGHYDDRLASIEAERADAESLSEADRLRTGLTSLVNDERGLYLQQFSQGFIGPTVARRLFAQADSIMDGVKIGGVEGYDAAVDKSLGFSRGFRAALGLQRHVNMTGPLAAALADRLDMLMATATAIREIRTHAADKITALFGAKTGEALDELLEARLMATDQQLEGLRLQYPEYAENLQSRLLERVALRLEAANYGAMVGQAVISHEVYSDLKGALDERKRALDERPTLDLGLEPNKLVGKVPFFADLDEARINEIAALLKPRLVLPGELVVHKGDPGDAMYFISTGAVEVDIPNHPVRLGSGDFFGEIALLKDCKRTATVTTVTECQLMVLSVENFHRLLRADPEIKEAITKTMEDRLAELESTGRTS
ncbi:MAG: cyclic nucleotide-binding domain-containing protein, partial [Proteobacteria bacterium]|nr:cyclic nucleotide-binding domain-containing protein [Pseudomonadota bacterium]